ncbi:MAG: peptidoglycan-associated lipoprotein Pal [Magnetococcales bacterium]|nr:peptidoglycan-associated lipoprotein Pal [Magnetococcales bacterium]
MKPLSSLIFSALLMGLIAGCSSSPNKPPPDPSQSLPPEGGYEQQSGTERGEGQAESGTTLNRLGGYSNDLDNPNRPTAGTWAATGAQRRVFFALNSSLLNEEATTLLRDNAGWLARQQGSVIIEGHCDERGTREYNLALGQQRAEAVVRFLISQGVDPNKIQAISYGKERPLVRGHSQSVWSKNRRAEIVVRSY